MNKLTLTEATAIGAAQTRPAFGAYFERLYPSNKIIAACWAGATAIGAGIDLLEGADAYASLIGLRKLWPWLDAGIAEPTTCPACGASYGGDVDDDPVGLGLHLNDADFWDREEISRYLEASFASEPVELPVDKLTEIEVE